MSVSRSSSFRLELSLTFPANSSQRGCGYWVSPSRPCRGQTSIRFLPANMRGRCHLSAAQMASSPGVGSRTPSFRSAARSFAVSRSEVMPGAVARLKDPPDHLLSFPCDTFRRPHCCRTRLRFIKRHRSAAFSDIMKHTADLGGGKMVEP